MIFVDASAFIAMLVGEAEAEALERWLGTDPLRCQSPLSAWETMSGLCRSYQYGVSEARARIELFGREMDLQMVSMGQREFEIAADAYKAYGKGRHKAALNMGDCFAYACAKTNRARLLFTGNDFTLTDIASARIQAT